MYESIIINVVIVEKERLQRELVKSRMEINLLEFEVQSLRQKLKVRVVYGLGGVTLCVNDLDHLLQ